MLPNSQKWAPKQAKTCSENNTGNLPKRKLSQKMYSHSTWLISIPFESPGEPDWGDRKVCGGLVSSEPKDCKDSRWQCWKLLQHSQHPQEYNKQPGFLTAWPPCQSLYQLFWLLIHWRTNIKEAELLMGYERFKRSSQHRQCGAMQDWYFYHRNAKCDTTAQNLWCL